MLRNNIERHLERRHGSLFEFWTQGGAIPSASVEAHCDMVYSLFLLGRGDTIPCDAIEKFVALLKTKNLPGWVPMTDAPPILVHNCAYGFGALNLLADDPAPLYEAVLKGRRSDLSQILDPASRRPVFPPKWAHHNWRVSHWIGGIPSILLSVARSGFSGAQLYAELVGPVRDATDALIDSQTGLLKAYRSAIVQKAFRTLYTLRHDPDLGDVGGVAHILWFDHAIGRRYVALEAVLEQSQKLFRRYAPFMETAPYCLDFDIVQIVRTGLEQTKEDRQADAARARQMITDIEHFFASPVSKTYTLHKIPGALATYHECALLAQADTQGALGTAPIDIIKSAYWL